MCPWLFAQVCGDSAGGGLALAVPDSPHDSLSRCTCQHLVWFLLQPVMRPASLSLLPFAEAFEEFWGTPLMNLGIARWVSAIAGRLSAWADLTASTPSYDSRQWCTDTLSGGLWKS